MELHCHPHGTIPMKSGSYSVHPFAPQPLLPLGISGRNLSYNENARVAKLCGSNAAARVSITSLVSFRSSPNFWMRYRCTLVGSMGLSPDTALTPSSVFLTGTARSQISTQNSSPRVFSLASLTFSGRGWKIPSARPFHYRHLAIRGLI